MSPVLAVLPAPLLQGGLAQRAESAIEAIAAGLAGMAVSVQPQRDFGLAAGGAGLALALAELSAAGRLRSGEGQVMARIERAVAALGAVRSHAGLFGGYTGTAWMVERLQDGFLDPDPGLNDEVDESLLETLGLGQGPLDHDLISGIVGIGVYGLERFPHGRSAELLETALDILEWRASWSDKGACWYAPVIPQDLLPEKDCDGPAPGSVNLGLSHGQPGVLAFLAGLLAAGVGGPRARTLLEAGVAWLLEHEGTADGRSHFSHAIQPDEPRRPSCRLAWCYGDLGIASALWLAGRHAQQPAWSAKALELMETAARRPVQDSGVHDPMLCHGAIGVAHAFHRFHRATGRETFRRAALHWTEHALHFHEEGLGIGGFRRFTLGNRVPDPYLLEGSAGLALGLLAGLGTADPAWDRFMLFSLPG